MPVGADADQRRNDHLLDHVDDRRPFGNETDEQLTCSRLVTRDEECVRSFRGRAHPARRRRCGRTRRSSFGADRSDVGAIDEVPTADEVRGQLAGAHPSVRRLIVDPEFVGSLLKIHLVRARHTAMLRPMIIHAESC